MPHVVLQHSNNVKIDKPNHLLKQINDLLTEQLPTELTSCKSRVMKFESYLIGNGNLANKGFIHLEISILTGRTSGLLSKISNNLIRLLYDNLSNNNSQLELDISVEIRNLNNCYAKIVKPATPC